MRPLSALRLSLLVAMGLGPSACGGQASESASGTGATSSTGGTGATSGTGGTGATSSTGGTGATSELCASPVVDATGLVSCEQGYEHRPKSQTCGSRSQVEETLPRAEDVDAVVRCVDAAGVVDESACRQFAYGYCNSPDSTICLSGCVTDQDCNPGYICRCGSGQSPTGGVCTSAPSCATDADCGEGSLCASYAELCSGSGFRCLTDDDECRTASDCPNAQGCGIGNGHRVCASCLVGRPFLVEAEVRVAPLRESDAWFGAERSPELARLTASEREALSRHWARLGQMEHASIAAFARFQLQLLALGAPPTLVDACTRAMADETAHTRICFELASAYAGRPLGPGKLDITGSLTPTSLADVVDLVLAEGCFGETSATLEALEEAERATDPVIAATYARIAQDEERHAALAFQFVRWGMQQEPGITASRVAAALESQTGSVAVREVVRPCLEALLASAGVAA